MPQVHEFLLYLLNYFYWFFETMDNTLSKNERYIDRSQMEKNRIRIAYANLLTCLRELGCKYAILLLGIDLKDFHHMRNGDLYYSCTHIDRTIYESLFIFSTYFTWITFYRQNFDSIRNELARLFRADGDVEMLQIPTTESLEGRMKNDTVIDSINRHKLIDCTEFFSKSMAKKAATTRISEIQNRKNSLQRTSLMFWNFNKKSSESNTWIKQNTSKSRLKSVLAKDFHDQRQKLFISQRKNRLRGILTKQLKSRNQSLIEEQYRHLKSSIGIIGKSYSDFDLIRLTLKPNIADNINMPTEFLVTLPDEMNNTILHYDQIMDNNHLDTNKYQV
ncbi:unnamed protein product [Rotaria sp. Silwood1]|nr:unnamed protein product [Rotaria sp. Silwood1]CAF1109853.1 unnamed protein product [Rotaria sp. Silwood1]CAF3434867.1 unnamed protein product [Rotaria sp. Silwood1]